MGGTTKQPFVPMDERLFFLIRIRLLKLILQLLIMRFKTGDSDLITWIKNF